MNSDGFGILIIDDEPNIRSGLAKGLAREADVLETAQDAEQGLAKFREGFFQLVIADVRLPGKMDGLELIDQILHIRPQTTTILITAHGTVETAVKSMRLGAFDFITKPLDLDLIRHQVRKAREHHRLQIENLELRNRLVNAGEVSGIIGNCAAMNDVFQQIRQVATTDATILIQGESGTGKELVARAVHDLSNRCSGPFIAVNLGAMPETLLESELFGHEKGSFSGATRQKPGCFEQAQGGSLFLDEVTEMPAKSQVDLLRVLETQQFMRVGGEEVFISDARIISATNKSVEPLIEDGSFREDLFYRLNVIPIQIPALRERKDDIPLLIEHFLTHFCQRHNRPLKQVSPEAMQKFARARWPGNVRQLRNVIERLVVTLPEEVIHATDIPVELNPEMSATSVPVKTLVEVTEAAEQTAITAALASCDYHREKTAKLLGVSVRTLHYKMSRYGLH